MAHWTWFVLLVANGGVVLVARTAPSFAHRICVHKFMLTTHIDQNTLMIATAIAVAARLNGCITCYPGTQEAYVSDTIMETPPPWKE
jgi:hypothetical protein